MNCKKGDMALVIYSWAGNEGKMVTCLELVGEHPIIDGEVYPYNDYWRIDTPMASRRKDGSAGPKKPFIRDSQLMPIRPDEMKHETEESEKVAEGV